jgi:hypothetical protein
MSISLIVLLAMTAAIALVAGYRMLIARHEDDSVHLADATGQLVRNQQKTAHTLQQIDRFGIGLTILTAVYGLALAANQVYIGLTQQRGL